MATPRRQSDEPVKLLSVRLPWTLYQQIQNADSVNARIIRLLKQALAAEQTGVKIK